MFGAPIQGPASIYCDNEAVYKNMMILESVLNKKMHGISCHFCRKAVAAKIVRVAKEDTLTNLVDLFTKVLGKVKRDNLLEKCMQWLCEWVFTGMVSHCGQDWCWLKKVFCDHMCESNAEMLSEHAWFAGTMLILCI